MKQNRLTGLQYDLLRAWLQTPVGNWPETCQAWQRCKDELPDGVNPEDWAHYVPRSEWRADRVAEVAS